MALAVKIAHHESGTATITIEKEDGTEFENGEKNFKYVESVDDDGIAELTSLEIKEQWEEFKTAEIDKLVVKVEFQGATKKSRPLEIVPPPKVLVNFRTGNAYKGEYGFDWLRMGDTGKPGDVFYKDIIGSYATGSFVQSDAEYIKLGKKFEMPNHPIKPKDKYVVPVLALLPNKKATLTLKVEIEGSDAKKIEYKYDKTYFKLDKTEVSHKTVGKKEQADDLTIECIKEFSKDDQFIEVDGKFAGKLKVTANGKAHRRNAKIVFVEVKTLIGTQLNTGISSGRKAVLKRFLNQALVEPKFDAFSPLNLDLSSDTKFNTIYATGVNTDIQDYLNTTLYNQYDKQKDYRGHYKVYFINEKKGYGIAYGVGASVHSVIVYKALKNIRPIVLWTILTLPQQINYQLLVLGNGNGISYGIT